MLAALETIRRRTFPNVGEHVVVRFSSLGDDGVLLGAAALVLRNELGIVVNSAQDAAAVQPPPIGPGPLTTKGKTMRMRTLAAGLAALTIGVGRVRLGLEEQLRHEGVGDDRRGGDDRRRRRRPLLPRRRPAATPAPPRPRRRRPPPTTVPVPITGGTGEGGEIRLWLNGGDTPDAMVKYAIAEFNKVHPDVKVTFERQQWTGIVEKLTTALSSSDSPDVIELGNTQAQAFEAAGALQDLTAKKAELGGDDLLQSLVEAGTYDGKFFGVPYYAGARVILYRKDLFEKSGLSGADDDRRDARRGQEAEGGQRVDAELLRHVPARQELVRRAAVHLGQRRRHRHPGRRRRGRASWRRTVR